MKRLWLTALLIQGMYQSGSYCGLGLIQVDYFHGLPLAEKGTMDDPY
jgi:hypothetical protein